MQTTIDSASEVTPQGATDRLIVALDCPSPAQADRLVRDLGNTVRFYKVGWRMFLMAGLGFVDELRGAGKKVFLDLKMDDIGETIETAVAELRGKADLLTLMGTSATVAAAVRGRGASTEPKLLSVTLLSSLDESDLQAMLPEAATMPPGDPVAAYVRRRAMQALEAGADGLIASGDSIRLLRDAVGAGALIVAPGIRLAGSAAHDQKRTKCPREAIAEGADLIVVGRPIWAAPDPVAAAEAVIADIQLGMTPG